MIFEKQRSTRQRSTRQKLKATKIFWWSSGQTDMSCVTLQSGFIYSQKMLDAWSKRQSIDVFMSCVCWTPFVPMPVGGCLWKNWKGFSYCVDRPKWFLVECRKILLDKPDFEIKNVILTARVPILNLGTSWHVIGSGFIYPERSVGNWWLSGSWIMEVVMLTFQWTTRRPHWPAKRLKEPWRCKIKISPALELQLIASHTHKHTHTHTKPTASEFCWEGVEKLSFAPCLCAIGSSYCWEPWLQADCWEFKCPFQFDYRCGCLIIWSEQILPWWDCGGS